LGGHQPQVPALAQHPAQGGEHAVGGGGGIPFGQPLPDGGDVLVAEAVPGEGERVGGVGGEERGDAGEVAAHRPPRVGGELRQVDLDRAGAVATGSGGERVVAPHQGAGLDQDRQRLRVRHRQGGTGGTRAAAPPPPAAAADL